MGHCEMILNGMFDDLAKLTSILVYQSEVLPFWSGKSTYQSQYFYHQKSVYLLYILHSHVSDISFITDTVSHCTFVDCSVLSLIYHSVGIGLNVEQLHHWVLIDFAVVLTWGYDSVVEMGWKYC